VLSAFSGAPCSELAGRLPVAPGGPAYVRERFRADRLAATIGLLVVGVAIVATAAISIGSAGYISVFLPLPEGFLVAGVVMAMGAVAAWGINESVSFAGAMTVIEVGGLIALVVAGIVAEPAVVTRLPEALPSMGDTAAIAGIIGATLLAVFAFLGFESLANVAEEVRDPKRTLPYAIFLTLVISTVLYVLVAWVALVAVPRAELAQSKAPLALVFERLTGASQRTMSAIAIIATLNGIIVQIIMSSRVLYGLARQGDLPAAFGAVGTKSRTPTVATALTTALVLALALTLPLHDLAEVTSRLTLVVFAVVNVSLIRIKRRAMRTPPGIFEAFVWVPWAGAAVCVVLLILDVATKLWS
jgi:amino acid transporter